MKNIKIILFALVLFAFGANYGQEVKTEKKDCKMETKDCKAENKDCKMENKDCKMGKMEFKTSSFEKFDAGRDAAKDIENAVKAAKQSGKNILLDVGGEWCPWCRALGKLFIENKEIADFISQNYEFVKVNYSKENKNESVLAKYPKIEGYPHLFVLDSEGKLLHSQDSGVLEKDKGHDPEKVMNFLKEWAPKNSKKAS